MIAFALATPIDDKTSLTRPSSASNPDISKLPLKKDDSSKDQVKVNLASSDSGVHAHPLHKRANDPPKVADQTSSAKQTPSNVPLTHQSSNAQHQRQPSNAPQNPQTQAARTPVASRPLAQSTGQAVHAGNSRVTRDAPKIADAKTGVPATSGVKANAPAVPAVPSTNNNNQKPLYNQQRKPSNGQAQSRPVSSNNAAKAQPAPLNPATAAKPATPAQPILSGNSRVKRDAPRVADSKASSPQVPATQAQKSQPIPTNQKQAQALPVPKVNEQKKAQQPAKVQTPAQSSRVTRDAPKPVDTKLASKPASTLPQKSQAPAPTSSQKQQPTALPQPPKVAAKTPVTNSRPVRDAPNPHEQSKIVPSAYQPAKSNPDQKTTVVKLSDKKDDVSSHPAVDAKKPSSPVSQNKRESPPTNLRESTQSSSSYDNQSPTFVHPVPVSQILKKSENSPASVGSA